jgi:hypothetical protein
MFRNLNRLLLIVLVIFIMARTQSKTTAGGILTPLAVDMWVYGSVQTADGVNVAGATVSMPSSNSTTNASGSWGLYWPLADNQVYTLDIQLPEGYMMTGAGGPGITGWEQDCLTFQTGAVGQLCGPFQLIVSEMIGPTETPWVTPTPPSYLYPPSIWPWPILVPSPADQIAIANGARQARGGPFKPIADMQDNRLWQIARDYQLGAQLGQEYEYNGYRCQEYIQGIVILGQDNIGFGVVSPFGSWGGNPTKE